jgi:LDH2 family malate/lactate/ureidoglycolate dehydrogenase
VREPTYTETIKAGRAVRREQQVKCEDHGACSTWKSTECLPSIVGAASLSTVLELSRKAGRAARALSSNITAELRELNESMPHS